MLVTITMTSLLAGSGALAGPAGRILLETAAFTLQVSNVRHVRVNPHCHTESNVRHVRVNPHCHTVNPHCRPPHRSTPPRVSQRWCCHPTATWGHLLRPSGLRHRSCRCTAPSMTTTPSTVSVLCARSPSPRPVRPPPITAPPLAPAIRSLSLPLPSPRPSGPLSLRPSPRSVRPLPLSTPPASPDADDNTGDQFTSTRRSNNWTHRAPVACLCTPPAVPVPNGLSRPLSSLICDL